MSNKQKPEARISIDLKNVRLSYPSLWVAKESDLPGVAPKFSANFIMSEKDNPKEIAALKIAIAKAMKVHFGDKPPHPSKVRQRLRDGAERIDDATGEPSDGYGPGTWYVAANNKNRPVVVDRQRRPLAAQDGKPYAGCYVNARVTTWVQDDKNGKGVNLSLEAIQFLKDGPPFSGAAPVNADDVFADLGEDEDDGDGAGLLG